MEPQSILQPVLDALAAAKIQATGNETAQQLIGDLQERADLTANLLDSDGPTEAATERGMEPIATSKPRLTLDDYRQAAHQLTVEVAAVRAVTSVESGGVGFLSDGRCVIRFEPHLFSRKTNGIYDQSHPDLSFPKLKPGYPTSVNQSWQLFREASVLNANAAVLSTSWGLFQILGSNSAACDCDTLSQFVKQMEASEAAQLTLFCSLVENWGLDDELRRKDWATFAKFYNGPNYKINKYDIKLAAAYQHFSTE